MGRLDGKVALITGAAHGMGAVDARLFAAEGAKVAIADLLEKEAQEVVAEIASAGGEAMFVPMDVRKREDWEHAISSVMARFGRLNVLVNNAGVSSFSRAPDDVEGWDSILDINAKGAYLGIVHCVPAMRRAGGGAIVNLSSTNGLAGVLFGHLGYPASKAAVVALTKAAAVRYAKDGIRVNAVAPGHMPPMRSIEFLDPVLREQVGNTTPLGRAGRREEVAYTVLFLASDEAGYITGVTIPVDGGYLAQ